MFNQKVLRGTQRLLSHLTNLKGVPFHSKYLGMPLCKEKSRSGTLEEIVGKVSQKVQGWKKSLLSQASITCLIKAVAVATPIYIMSSLVFPKRTCAKIDAILRDFWWDKRGGKKVMYLKAWETICTPKIVGGSWSIFSREDKLWVHYLKAKYLRGKFFWKVHGSQQAS